MKMLMIATVPSMIGMFNMDNIRMLREKNVVVHIACNFNNNSTWSIEKKEKFLSTLKSLNVIIHQIDFSRNPYDLIAFMKCKKQLLLICKDNKFDFIHCHTPICSIITRSVARKLSIPVIYTAHGFHFYKGAPVLNWILYYSIEKYYSKYTDCLITINEEDYTRSCKKFHAKKNVKIPGIGVDFDNIQLLCRKSNASIINKNDKDFVIVSVGELNKNKNHITIIKAIKTLNNKHIKYYICGCGGYEKKLNEYIKKYHLEDNVILLGYVNNVVDVLKEGDIFAFPSYREGLGLAAIEAMACGLPLITSNVHGINDYSNDGVTGFKCSPNDYKKFALFIKKLYNSKDLRKKMGASNIELAKKYNKNISNSIMLDVYSDFIKKRCD